MSKIKNRTFKPLKSSLAISVIACVLAGCSSDAMRFGSNPNDNPYKSSSRPSTTNARTAPTQNTTPSRGGFGVDPVTTNSISPRTTSSISSNPTTTGVGQWSVANGTIVSAQNGDTLDKLSYRYGVPANAIASANGLNAQSQIAPGQKIVIPVLNNGATSNSTPTMSAAQEQVQQKVQTSALTTKSAPAKTKTIAQPIAEPISERIAERTTQTTQPAKTIAQTTKQIPQPQMAEKQLQTPLKTTTAKIEPDAQKTKQIANAKNTKVTEKIQKTASIKTPEVAEEEKEAVVQKPKQVASLQNATKDDDDAKETASFRWPVKGRVISSFGAKGNGSANDGINIAVPEGTPVRAAEDGQVVYSGSDLKGYGNMVLVRHDNGYVSAYAHNSKVNVKKGDRVTRGQVVANSGTSGDVSSPQLHFELRKGSTPVNPLTYLP